MTPLACSTMTARTWGGSFPYREHSMAGFKAKFEVVEQGIHDAPWISWWWTASAEGDQVVLELRNGGQLPDGRP